MNVRHDIVRLRDTERLTERAIARRLELPHSTVHYWLSKHDTPTPTIPRPRGRPRVTSLAVDGELYQQSLNHPFQSAVEIRDEIAPHVSADTVRKRLKELGLKCRVPARKPFLREEHLERRLLFARNHLHWNDEQWDQVVFSDEKIFRSSSRGALRVYRPQRSNRFEQRYLVHSSNPAGRFTICVWMAFGESFRAMELVTRPTLNATYYTQVILPSIEGHLVANDKLFMQDLSSIHTSYQTRHWFESHNLPWMEDWPPKGPDMNPVENVWAELVRRTRNDATNRTQLWENVHAAFLGLEEAYFVKLMRSMPKRMANVVRAEGGWTGY